VDLRVEPAHLASGKAHVAGVPALGDEATVERRQRDHDAVGMRMRARLLSRLVTVLEDTNALVLEDDPVLVGVGLGRIGHGGAPSSARQKVAADLPQRTGSARCVASST
jgi:hypothetical protein